MLVVLELGTFQVGVLVIGWHSGNTKAGKGRIIVAATDKLIGIESGCPTTVV